MTGTFINRDMDYYPSGGMHPGQNHWPAKICFVQEQDILVHLWVFPNIPDTAPFRVENVPVLTVFYPPPTGAHCRYSPVAGRVEVAATVTATLVNE